MNGKTLLVLIILIAGGICPAKSYSEQQNTKITGVVQIKGKPVVFKYGYAWMRPSSLEEKQWDLHILFSEQPQQEPQNIPSRSPLALEIRSFAITSPDGFGLSANLFLSATRIEAVSSTGSGIVITKFDTKIMEGSASHDDSEHKWDISFSIPVLQEKKVAPMTMSPFGIPLSADGGEPVKGYRAYLESLNSGLPANIKKNTTRKFGEELLNNYVENAPEKLKGKIKPNFRMVSGFSNGRVAILFLNSDAAGTQRTGVVKLLLTDGLWKVSTDLFTSFSVD